MLPDKEIIMVKAFKKLSICLFVALVACCMVACGSSSGSGGSSSATSSSSGSSGAVALDKNIEQAPVTYSVSGQWKQSGGKTGDNSSEFKYETGTGANSLTVKVEDPSTVETPANEFEKLRVNWVDYQGATNWQASNASHVKVGNADCTVYQCSWKLKNGTAVNMKIGYIPTSKGFIVISYFYDSGDSAIFDAVLASMKIA